MNEFLSLAAFGVLRLSAELGIKAARAAVGMAGLEPAVSWSQTRRGAISPSSRIKQPAQDSTPALLLLRQGDVPNVS